MLSRLRMYQITTSQSTAAELTELSSATYPPSGFCTDENGPIAGKAVFCIAGKVGLSNNKLVSFTGNEGSITDNGESSIGRDVTGDSSTDDTDGQSFGNDVSASGTSESIVDSEEPSTDKFDPSRDWPSLLSGNRGESNREDGPSALRCKPIDDKVSSVGYTIDMNGPSSTVSPGLSIGGDGSTVGKDVAITGKASNDDDGHSEGKDVSSPVCTCSDWPNGKGVNGSGNTGSSTDDDGPSPSGTVWNDGRCADDNGSSTGNDGPSSDEQGTGACTVWPGMDAERAPCPPI